MTAPSSITAQAGRNLLLKLGNGASPEVYTTVTGLRVTDITINGSPVDITNKSSAGWQELLAGAGVRSCDITAQGIFDSNNSVALATLAQSALDGGTLQPFQLISGSGDYFTGYWSVATFKRSGPYNDAETFDMTLRSHGVITHTAGP